jgi:Transglutaminase-like superfamily
MSTATEAKSDGSAGRIRASDLWLVGRLFLWSLALPLLKRLLPLEMLVRLAWSRPRRNLRRPELERRVMRLVHAVWGRSPAARGDGNCLERSLAVYRFLSRLNAEPELVAGMRKGPGDVLGHVWVAVDGEPFGESAQDLARYVPVIAFGAGGRETWRSGAEVAPPSRLSG